MATEYERFVEKQLRDSKVTPPVAPKGAGEAFGFKLPPTKTAKDIEDPRYASKSGLGNQA